MVSSEIEENTEKIYSLSSDTVSQLINLTAYGLHKDHPPAGIRTSRRDGNNPSKADILQKRLIIQSDLYKNRTNSLHKFLNRFRIVLTRFWIFGRFQSEGVEFF